MNRDYLVDVIVEVERHSNMKWEYDRLNDSLFLDRVLPYPYFYPYAYGFFPETLAEDGDELDALLITEKSVLNYQKDKKKVRGYIVGGLMMYDEKGADSKIFVVPENEIVGYLNKSDKEKTQMHEDIVWFFSNYKKKDYDSGKWSRVESIMTYPESLEKYIDSKKLFSAKKL